jgi:hypothetical protein
LRDQQGCPIEEFDIIFLDGEDIDAELFDTLRTNQARVPAYLQAMKDWSYEQKRAVVIAVAHAGHDFDLAKDSPDQFEIDLYEVPTLRDLAIQFVDEGLFGDIPENVKPYLDYDLIARDLSADYTEITVAGKRYVYHCD